MQLIICHSAKEKHLQYLLFKHCAHGGFVWLIGSHFFQMFHNSTVIEMKSFLFLHKTELQSKITSARNDVSLPACNILTAWLYRCDGVLLFMQRSDYLTAMKKATSSKAISR